MIWFRVHYEYESLSSIVLICISPVICLQFSFWLSLWYLFFLDKWAKSKLCTNSMICVQYFRWFVWLHPRPQKDLRFCNWQYPQNWFWGHIRGPWSLPQAAWVSSWFRHFVLLFAMGVKTLWPALDCCGESVSVTALKGKTLAIDLAGKRRAV